MSINKPSTNTLSLNIINGLTDYKKAYDLQLETVKKRKEDKIRDTLILLEHSPVITLGKNANQDGVVASKDYLQQHKINVHQTERGGQVTYHGPGQITGYPIVNLHHLKIGAAKYVSNLEETMIIAAKTFGIDAVRRDKMTGIFAKGKLSQKPFQKPYGKIGAIGVRITNGVTFHGFAFNVCPDLTHYQLIVPCGMTETPVSSVMSILENNGDHFEKSTVMEKAKKTIAEAFCEVFDLKVSL